MSSELQSENKRDKSHSNELQSKTVSKAVSPQENWSELPKKFKDTSYDAHMWGLSSYIFVKELYETFDNSFVTLLGIQYFNQGFAVLVGLAK